MIFDITIPQLIIGLILILSSLGVILTKKPVYSSLYFLVTLIMLAALYLQLSAEFIAVMQVIVYAGAILVIFMFVIILFQDAHGQIAKYRSQCYTPILIASGAIFVLSMIFLGTRLLGIKAINATSSDDFGSPESLGRTLYVDFFFPFEAVILIFLVALVGALYIGKKENA